MNKLTHTQRVENWLGKECLEHIVNTSVGMKHPIPITNVPGKLFAYDGEIYGTIIGGSFSSLSDLINKATTGNRQDMLFSKAGTLAVNGSWASLWNVGSYPSAGGAPTAISTGSVPTNLTNGSFKQENPSGSNTLHITTVFAQGTAAPNTLLLYDRLWHGASVLHTSTAAQPVSGLPNRYTGTASAGNRAFLEVTTLLGATAQNLTMTYVDNSGNSAEAAAALAIIASSAVTRIPHVPYFIPINAGDTGIQRITQLQFSAANSAGVSNIVMCHPLAFIPCPVANSMSVMDGINSAFNLVQIQNNACLSFLEVKGVGTATRYDGQLIMVSG